MFVDLARIHKNFFCEKFKMVQSAKIYSREIFKFPTVMQTQFLSAFELKKYDTILTILKSMTFWMFLLFTKNISE